ncbi:MAG: enoyl-CoA hydratase/isomerase family protein [Candidatus Nitrosocosmicus sp.]
MKNVNLDVVFDNICILKINRPDMLNAIDKDVLLDLKEAVDFVKNDDKIKIVIITGEGDRAFCSGGDLKYVSGINPTEAEKFASGVHRILNDIENLGKPVIAAINGYALGGGCQLALACDIRIASCNALLGQPEVKLGITPGWGGTQRLSRIIGIAHSKELIYTGKVIDAYKANQIGLVNQVVEIDNDGEVYPSNSIPMNKTMNNNLKRQNEKGEEILTEMYLKMLKIRLMEEVIRISKQISKNSYNAIKISKALINKGMGTNIETGLQLEIYGNALSFANPERKNMMSSFLNNK